MNDFDYEVKQKRELARAARYRKRGSKSKKCSLPSDYLTQKQLRERNGNVEYYSLNAPMKWATYKTMPDDLKAEYITSLANRYHVTQTDIAEMMGVSRSYMVKEIHRLQCWPFTAGKNHTAHKDILAWVKFLGDFNRPATEDPKTGCPELDTAREVPNGSECCSETKASNVVLTCGELTFSGRVSDVMARLESILGGNNRYTLTIKFEEAAQ